MGEDQAPSLSVQTMEMFQGRLSFPKSSCWVTKGDVSLFSLSVFSPWRKQYFCAAPLRRQDSSVLRPTGRAFVRVPPACPCGLSGVPGPPQLLPLR